MMNQQLNNSFFLVYTTQQVMKFNSYSYDYYTFRNSKLLVGGRIVWVFKAVILDVTPIFGEYLMASSLLAACVW